MTHPNAPVMLRILTFRHPFLHYVVCNTELGLENEGKHAIVVHSLHGRKSAGADHWQHARRDREKMGFLSCKADPDVWLRPALKYDRVEYYKHVLLHKKDILSIMKDPVRCLRKELRRRFNLKEKSISAPN